MHVIVQHRISDPAAFWAAAEQGLPHLPTGLSLHGAFPNADSSAAVCLWEARSAEAVQDFLEPLIGHASANEYFAVDAERAIGLPQGPFTLAEVVAPTGARTAAPPEVEEDRRAPQDLVAIEVADDPAARARENARLIHDLYDAYNDRDFDRAAGRIAPGAELVNPGTGETFRGPEGIRTFMQRWAAAFPDSRVEVTHIQADEHTAVVEFTGRGTHTGPLATPAGTIPPTGRRVELHFCDVYRLSDGKVARQHFYSDSAALLAQIGVAPPPVAAAPQP